MSTDYSGLAPKLERARQFFDSLWETIERCQPATSRGRADVPAVALHSVALEHATAIVMLVDAGLSAPAFALTRPMMDAYVRALWIRECADEPALEKALRYDKFPGHGTLLSDLAKGGAEVQERAARLNKLHGDMREGLHSLTHGGMQQLCDRVHEFGIQGRPPMERLESLLELAIGHGVLVAAALWTIYEDEAFMNAAIQIFEKAVFPAASARG